MNIQYKQAVFLFLQRVHVTLRVHRVRSAISWLVSVFVFRERTAGSVIAVCPVTGASPPADPAPATDTLTSATPTLDAASAAGTTPLDTPVTGELHLWCHTHRIHTYSRTCIHHLFLAFCLGVWMVTMVTQRWGQVTTVVLACVLMAPAACGSSQEVVTVVTTPNRLSVSATLDTRVKT